METRIVATYDQKEEIVSLVRRLPAILTGNAPDENGIAAGFKARLGYTLLSLIAPNFNVLGRGGTGADGDKWPPLSQRYLAYGRRFGPGEQTALKKAAGLGKGHRHAPGGKSGLMNAAQQKEWNKVFAMHTARLVLRGYHVKEAKSIAAGIAYNHMKGKGVKTKLEVYGNRQVQILVDTGRLRNSLMPGTLYERGVDAAYQRPGAGSGDQIFTAENDRVTVGTNVKYAIYHHAARPPRKLRRLWPREFPDDWWRQLLGSAISGLQQLGTIIVPGG